MSRLAPDTILERLNTFFASVNSIDETEADRDTLMCELMVNAHRLGALSTLYSISTAEHLGMNLSDMLCLGILSRTGPMTAGQLASMIGLSTGSVTGLVDRLERLDLVRRERDEEDRRRIVIHLNAGRAQEIGHALVPMLEAGWKHFEQFTDDDLRVIFRYMDGAIRLMQSATEDMRSRGKAPFAAPLAEGRGES